MRVIRTLLLTVLALPGTVNGDDFSFVLDDRWTVSGGPCRAVAFSPAADGLVVATGRQGLVFAVGEDSRVTSQGEIAISRKEILDLAVSPDGQVIAAVDAGGALQLYDRSTLRSIKVIQKAHSGKAQAVSFTLDGRYLLTGDHKGRLKIWSNRGDFFADLAQGAEHEAGIVMVGGAAPGRHAISVGEDRRVILWNVDTQRAVRPTMVDMDVLSAATSGDGKILALGLELLRGNTFRSATFASARETEVRDAVRLIDAEKGTVLRDLTGGDQELNAVSVSPDGRFVAAGGSGSSASVWDAVTGKLVTTIPFDEPATVLEFSPDGRRLAAGSRKGSLSLFGLTGVGPASRPEALGKIILVIIQPEVVMIQGRSTPGPPPRVRTSTLQVRGRIKTSSPVTTLQVAGREITSLSLADAGDYLFTAFVPLPIPGPRQIDVVVENQAGQRALESFVVEREIEVAAPAQGAGRRLALIVGISDYADDSIDLEYAHRDAQALYRLLTSADQGPAAFKPEDVMLLVDEQATVANINIGLRQFLQKAREDDFVLIFFAGHGVPDPNRLKNLYLLAHDTSPGDIAGTGLLAKNVRETISEIPARQVVLLADSCHSAGIGAPDSIRSLTVNPIHQAFLDRTRHASAGMAILTASEAAQVSVEGEQWAGHGVFTYFLLKGLKGEADENDDGIVALGEIMEYVRERVRSETKSEQIPAIGPTSFDRELPIVVVGGDR